MQYIYDISWGPWALIAYLIITGRLLSANVAIWMSEELLNQWSMFLFDLLISHWGFFGWLISNICIKVEGLNFQHSSVFGGTWRGKMGTKFAHFLAGKMRFHALGMGFITNPPPSSFSTLLSSKPSWLCLDNPRLWLCLSCASVIQFPFQISSFTSRLRWLREESQRLKSWRRILKNNLTVWWYSCLT